ncbi:MAG TPA: hypothetical protein VED41_13770, partial [Solirubrobacteraceae bacterium]|nr:hypothetical protein [Solirubrobacteraceae bacterium]
WSYTGPLLGIVVAALVVGEVIIWALFHPHEPGKAIFHRGHPHARPHLRHRSATREPPGAAKPAPGAAEPLPGAGAR